MSAPLLFWAATLCAAVWTAYATGHAWLESRHAGGAIRAQAWACAVLAGAAFTAAYLWAALYVITAVLGYALPPEAAFLTGLGNGVTLVACAASLWATGMARWADGYRLEIEAAERERIDRARGRYPRTARAAVGHALDETKYRSRLAQRRRSAWDDFDVPLPRSGVRSAVDAGFGGGRSGGAGASAAYIAPVSQDPGLKMPDIDLGDSEDSAKVAGVLIIVLVAIVALGLGAITAATIISRVAAVDAPLAR